MTRPAKRVSELPQQQPGLCVSVHKSGAVVMSIVGHMLFDSTKAASDYLVKSAVMICTQKPTIAIDEQARARREKRR